MIYLAMAILLLPVPAAVYVSIRWWRECVRRDRRPQLPLGALLFVPAILTPSVLTIGYAPGIELRITFSVLAIDLVCGGVLGWLASCMESETRPPAPLRVLTGILTGAVAYALLCIGFYLVLYWVGVLRIPKPEKPPEKGPAASRSGVESSPGTPHSLSSRSGGTVRSASSAFLSPAPR